MVHITDALLPCPKILEFMKPGDVVTHCPTSLSVRIMGPEKKEILREVRDAQKAGVIFGLRAWPYALYLSFRADALDQGFMPDTIATDLSIPSATRGPVFDLPTTMSKFLNLGVSLDEVFRCVTTNPARAIGEG
jgi:dihydroorotase